jgi:hypothetical protein
MSGTSRQSGLRRLCNLLFFLFMSLLFVCFVKRLYDLFGGVPMSLSLGSYVSDIGVQVVSRGFHFGREPFFGASFIL